MRAVLERRDYPPEWREEVMARVMNHDSNDHDNSGHENNDEAVSAYLDGELDVRGAGASRNAWARSAELRQLYDDLRCCV